MSTLISLAKRRYGTHKEIRSVTIEPDVVVSMEPAEVDEDALLKALPVGFLPRDPENILLMIADSANGGTAVRKPSRFRAWGKYFDSFSLTAVPKVIADARESADKND